ncbi:hypothetical protein TNCV_1105081 [Trichonephila clavipes]|nr:hypothetical protein TNCV_1105081 [Trichonephila clavipes]
MSTQQQICHQRVLSFKNKFYQNLRTIKDTLFKKPRHRCPLEALPSVNSASMCQRVAKPLQMQNKLARQKRANVLRFRLVLSYRTSDYSQVD